MPYVYPTSPSIHPRLLAARYGFEAHCSYTACSAHNSGGEALVEGIAGIVRSILDAPGYDFTTLGAELGVSAGTVERWASGKVRPRPAAEGRLRALYNDLAPYPVDEPSLFTWSEPAGTHAARRAIDHALAHIREALHRRGRLSSRNEALDEASVLLFAHIMSEADGGTGVSPESIAAYGATTAVALRSFVEDVVAKHLPASLAHEMVPADFALRLKPQEDELAVDIVEAFSEFRSAEALTSDLGASAADVLNDVFGKFLADSFVDEKELGQYLTPVEVVQFMVRLALMDLSAGERRTLASAASVADFGLVLDPSCGVGSFLAEFLRTAHGDLVAPEESEEWLSAMTTTQVVGIDKSERMVRLALANLAMFGFPAARLHLANSLARRGRDAEVTRALDGSVGLILTNPPFGAEFRGEDLSEYRIAADWASRKPSSVDSELLFLERYIEWLRPGGQLLAIVPDSILTNKNLFDDLRRGLAPLVSIRTVVSLPSVTFASAGTTTKTSVLHLRKKPFRRSDTTRFAICEDVGYSVAVRGSRRTKVRTSGGEFPQVLEALAADARAMIRTVPEAELGHRWDATYHASLPPTIQARIDRRTTNDVLVADIATLSSDKIDPRRLGTGTFRYIEISDVDAATGVTASKPVVCADAPSRARRRVRAGDVLVSTVRPERKCIGVVGIEDDGAVCTTGFAVVRPTGIEPWLLAALLRTDFVASQLLRNNIGIAYPAIEEQCLPAVLLPIARADISALQPEATDLLRLERELRDRRRQLTELVASTVAAWSNA